MLAAVSAAFVALEVRDGWGDVSGAQMPGAGWLVLAVGVLAAGQLAIGEAMATLPAASTDIGDRRWAFHLTQPAKYVPAGVAQAVGVVVVLVDRGAGRAAALVVWMVHTGSVIVAGLMVGLVTAPALGWSPLVALLGVVLGGVISRPVLGPVFDRAGRVFGASELVVPPAGALGRCLVAALVGVTLHGLGFALLVDGASLDIGLTEAIAAYTLAFGISVATPLPGGLGAREAIIFGLLAASEETLIVPVVLVRLLLIAIELGLFVVARTRSRR
jgi:uncharacterized membrane protein YbhN (UPF0104 family)